jgi:hypothetical protein
VSPAQTQLIQLTQLTQLQTQLTQLLRHLWTLDTFCVQASIT